MSEVIDIRPEVSAERVIDPHYIDCRVDQLIRETESIGMPALVVLYNNGVPIIRTNWHAADQPHMMCGVLDEAKDFLRGVFPLDVLEESEGEDDAG